MTAIAALWIQMKNRNGPKLPKIMPTGLDKWKATKQKIIFEYEGQELKVEYIQDRDGQFIFQTIVDKFIPQDNDTIDVMYDGKKHSLK